MKTLQSFAIPALAILALTSLGATASAEDPNRGFTLHLFRSPSIGLEYRERNVGVHAGLYSTILNRGGKSTEFAKLGVTYYYRVNDSKRFENFVSIAGVRGLNRAYEDKNGFFIESGFRYVIGGQWEVRLGAGTLISDGFRPKVNPTIGISYRF